MPPHVRHSVTVLLQCSGGSRISQMGGGTNPPGGGENLLFGKIFAKNCMKMMEIERGGGGM